ncbi:MAG: E3 binding domain-containing protein, partial [Flavobacterium sp.]|nr:E3 binding domain-containing protein [Flavobacterium sp.]
MAIVDLIMPKLGESIMEATILKWHKNVGDRIEQDETLLDIATDKVDSEVPSTVDGTVKEILFDVNDVVAVGSVIAKIETAVAVASTPIAPQTPIATAPIVVPVHEQIYQAPITPQPEEIEPPFLGELPYVPQNITTAGAKNNNSFFSPSVLSIANSVGISLSELEKIKGTGEDGRVTKKDILEYVPENSSPLKSTGNNRFLSPLVLNIANSEGISLAELELIEGTGTDGRISKRDVLQYVANKKAGLIPAYATPQTIYSAPPTPTEIVPQPTFISEPVAAPVQAAFVAPSVEPVLMHQQPVVASPIVTVPQPVVTVPQPVVTVPQHEGTVSQREGTVPQHVVTVPQHEVTVPQREGTVPQHVVTVSQREGTV